jgi:PAS domain S-box-containing protein
VPSSNIQAEHTAVEVLRFASRFRQASKAISAVVTSLGLVVLAGWAFNVPALMYIRPSFQSMKVNTAMSFLCLGTGLWLAQGDKWQRSRRILGFFVVTIAGLTLAEYAFHVSFGIDQLLFRDTRTPSLSAYPGRMAIATAICFLLLGLAVALLGTKKAAALQRSLVAACFALSLLALCGYLYGVHSLYSITAYSTVAVHTAAGFVATCLAYFLARPDEGILSIAASDTNSGLLLRALIPAIIVVPIMIGWLRLAGQRANLYDTSFGVALQVIGSIGCLTALTLVIARSMYRLEWEHSRAEEARFRHAAVVESSEDAIASGTLDGIIVGWNAGAERMYGYTEAEAIGKPITILVPPELPDEENKILETLRAGRRIEHFETVRVTKTGKRVNVSLTISPIKDSSGRTVGLSGIARDITERKRAEEALRASEERLKVFVKNVPAGVAMLDREMRYLQVSDRWCADYGVDASQMLGRSHYEIFPDIPQRWKEVHRRGLEGETLRAEEDRWDRQGGFTTWVRWEIRPWKTPNGGVGGILIFSEQITQRKQMEEALSGMARRLLEAQEHERARIARELHDDINQRLALLAVELEQLQGNPSEVQKGVQELRKQTTEISDAVQALSHDLHSSQLEYLGVVAGMKSWCKEFGDRQGVQIDCRHDVRNVLPPEIGLCLFRVLQEALHNAAKHSGVKRIEVQLAENSGEIHLIVRDLGKGFDIEAARQGRGLGLTSMRERVRLVNGTITIESKAMGGTTIHVRVPFESEDGSQRVAR